MVEKIQIESQTETGFSAISSPPSVQGVFSEHLGPACLQTQPCPQGAMSSGQRTHTHIPWHLVGVPQKSPEASDRKEGREHPLRRNH